MLWMLRSTVTFFDWSISKIISFDWLIKCFEVFVVLSGLHPPSKYHFYALDNAFLSDDANSVNQLVTDGPLFLWKKFKFPTAAVCEFSPLDFFHDFFLELLIPLILPRRRAISMFRFNIKSGPRVFFGVSHVMMRNGVFFILIFRSLLVFGVPKIYMLI